MHVNPTNRKWSSVTPCVEMNTEGKILWPSYNTQEPFILTEACWYFPCQYRVIWVSGPIFLGLKPSAGLEVTRVTTVSLPFPYSVVILFFLSFSLVDFPLMFSCIFELHFDYIFRSRGKPDFIDSVCYIQAQSWVMVINSFNYSQVHKICSFNNFGLTLNIDLKIKWKLKLV